MQEPIGFPGLIGHRRVCTLLSRAHARGRLHHALVFVGPRGVGKRTLARGLACALLCRQEPGRGCGACVSCRRVLAGRHTDLALVSAGGRGNLIRVEQAEELVLQVQQAPFEGAAHVVVIEPADRLHEAAANKLLKAIEEPRPGVYFVLLTGNEREVLPTVLSRCLMLPLARLDEAGVAEVVAREIRARSLSPEPDRVQIAVQLAQGCPGVALELLTDPTLEATRELAVAAIEASQVGPPAIFGGDRSPLWESFGRAVAAIPDDPEEAPADSPSPRRRAREVRKSSSARGDATPAKQRAAAGRLADLWLLHLRERLRGSDGVPGLPPLRDLAGPALARQLQRVQAFQNVLARNPNVRLALESTLLDLSDRAPTP